MKSPKTTTAKPAKKQPAVKPGFVACPDCGAQYKAGMPHVMFCKAHTCDECGASFPFVLDAGEDGRRLCETCEFEA